MIADVKRSICKGFAFEGRLNGGRSGADLLKVRTLGAAPGALVLRVTSLQRARREIYTLRNLPAARALIEPDLGPGPVSVVSVRRHFPIAVTITRFVDGTDVSESADAWVHAVVCPQYEALFEGGGPFGSSWRRVGVPMVYDRRHNQMWKYIPESMARRIDDLFSSSGPQSIDLDVLHGDPSTSNLIYDTDGKVRVVDCAQGGIGWRQLQRARWINSLALHSRGGLESQRCCPMCMEAFSPILAVLDCLRRISSCASRDDLRDVLITRLDQLLNCPFQ